MDGKRTARTNVDLSKTDFAAIAKGAGIFSTRVEESEDVAGALEHAFANQGPARVDVVTSKHELGRRIFSYPRRTVSVST